MRRDLGAVRMPDRGQSDRPQKDRIRRPAAVFAIGFDVPARLGKISRARPDLVIDKPRTTGAGKRRIHHGDRGLAHIDADAIALDQRDFHLSPPSRNAARNETGVQFMRMVYA